MVVPAARCSHRRTTLPQPCLSALCIGVVQDHVQDNRHDGVNGRFSKQQKHATIAMLDICLIWQSPCAHHQFRARAGLPQLLSPCLTVVTATVLSPAAARRFAADAPGTRLLISIHASSDPTHQFERTRWQQCECEQCATRSARCSGGHQPVWAGQLDACRVWWHKLGRYNT